MKILFHQTDIDRDVGVCIDLSTCVFVVRACTPPVCVDCTRIQLLESNIMDVGRESISVPLEV